MINIAEFSNRLQKVITHYDESAASFAEKIGVQRSSISHILSGRNKPSLDFVMKVLHAYPEVELYWLLNGKGHFPSSSPKPSTLFTDVQHVATSKNETTTPESSSESISTSEIEQIVIFYKDGSFKTYKNTNK